MRPQFKKEVKKTIKELLENEKTIKKETSGKSWKGFVPKSQQKKIEISQRIWELLIKEAIYCLREKDPKDPNEFKQDFGIIEIKDYFQKFSDFEEVLHGTDRYYRDHSLHVIRVFLIGFYLLNESLTDDPKKIINFNKIDIIPGRLSNEFSIFPEEKQAIWTIIAFTHDLGYPIEKIDKINSKITGLIQYYGPSGIEEFKYSLPLQNQFLNDFILKFISSKLIKKEEPDKYYTVIQNKYYLKFAKAFENLGHGIMSCILLMKHLVYFKESDYSHSRLNHLNSRDAKQFLTRSTILRSIASHDNDDIYHIYPNNFLFLLTFCDDLQEWDRPRLAQRFQQTDNVSVTEFSLKLIHFNKHFNLPEADIKSDILVSFSRSVKKYIKLFRSGPESQKREFTFKYSIILKTKKGGDVELFTFEYPPESAPKINIPILDDDKINYLDVFLDYIQNEANIKIEGLIKQIVDRIGVIDKEKVE